MKINLRNVTLCVADCITPTLSLKAIEKSQSLCNFNDAIIFTDSKINSNFCKVTPIEKIKSTQEYSQFILKKLNAYINTDFALIIQWDGYVLDASAWHDCFTEYDYIGAKWAWHKDGFNVGNGGFSLRSKRLLDATSDPKFIANPVSPEDEQICRANRAFLTNQFGIKFASENIADLFSYERTFLDKPTFGFHGLFNMHRHCNDQEMLSILNELAPRTCNSREFIELMFCYYAAKKYEIVRIMYLRNQTVETVDEFRSRVRNLLNNDTLTNSFCNVCESLI